MSTPPNILFLLTDQQRADTVEPGLSPNLLRLAAEGVRFTSAYASAPVCTPARAAILTGRSTWRHGLLGWGEIAPRYGRDMPATMAALGYRTAVVGKNHFGWKDGEPVSHGYESLAIYDGLTCCSDHYDRWFEEQLPGEDPLKTGGLGWNDWGAAPYIFDEYLHPTAWTGRKAVKQIRAFAKENKQQQPFFLKVSFHRPHSPYDPPERFLNATAAPSAPPVTALDGWDEPYKECGLFTGAAPGGDSPSQWCGAVDPADLELTRRAYRALVRQVDDEIGSILVALNETGFANNTFVLFVSDHGDEQNDHYLWKKGYPYQGSVHVPLIVRWPEAMDAAIDEHRGSVSKAVVELRDIFPTFVDVSGHWNTSFEADMDGRPLTWLLRDGSPGWRQELDLEFGQFYIHAWNAVTNGEMKYIFHAFSGDEQLFNLTEDPGEQRDLVRGPHHSAALEFWRERLVDQFLREERGLGWVWGRRLMPRFWIPCTYSPHYPDSSALQAVCTVASTVSWPLLFAVAALLLLLMVCCIVCACRRSRGRCCCSRCACHTHQKVSLSDEQSI